MVYDVFVRKGFRAEEHRRHGFELMDLGKHDEAIKEHQRAEKLHKEINDFGGVAGDITNIAIIYEKIGDLKKAFEMHEDALRIDLEINYKPGLRIDYSNLSRLYAESADLEKSLDYQMKLIDVLFELGDLSSAAQQYRDRGFILSKMEKTDKAILSHKEAKKLNEKIEDWGAFAGDITNIALLYEQKGELEKALKLHLEALAIDEKIDFKQGLRIDYTNLFKIYTERRDFKKATYYQDCLIKVVSELTDEQHKKTFLVGASGVKGQIKIIKQSPNLYTVGYSVPSPIRRRERQFPTMINDDRLSSISEKIDALTESINKSRELMTRDPHTGEKEAEKVINDLIELGLALYALALPAEVKRIYEKLKKVHAIELGISDDIIQYPWELMHDGSNFMSLKNSLGRYVISDAPEVPYQFGAPRERLKFLIVGDPCKDIYPYYNPPYEHLLALPGARNEAEQLASRLRQIESVEVKLLIGSEVNIMRMIAELSSNYDFIHFSGHATFLSDNPTEAGLLLHDGLLRAYEIMQCIATQNPSPVLAFINACNSSRETDWKPEVSFVNQVFGLASSYLRNGVNYIGSIWPIHDDSAVEIALDFYKEIFKGQNFGKALQKARINSFKKHKGKAIVWASYVLYGDPTFVIK